jgi:peptide/nickel transport system ATP-binding protein
VDSTQNILSVEGLHIRFDGQPFSTVKDLSFTLGKGETLAIVGESGSGKSLTAFALMGLLPKTAGTTGSMLLHAPGGTTDLAGLTLHNGTLQRGNQVSMVFQEPMSALNPVMKIGRQLQEAILAHNKITQQEAKLQAVNWLGKVQLPHPEQLYNRYPHQLSGGQKQRVMIAMAMCNHPTLLIADEPTTALDVTVQQEIIRLMSYLQQEFNTAMIFITHDLALATTISDKILVMYKGEVQEYGPTESIINAPQSAYTKALLACRPSQEHKGHLLPTVQDVMNGNYESQPIPPTAQLADTLITVDKLDVWFPTGNNKYFKAVNNVSFNIKKGEILGLVGESGCGKSTISKAMMGILPATHGSIVFKDKDLTKLSIHEWKAMRTRIQMIFQDPYSSLNPRMTIGDALREPLNVHRIVPAAHIDKEVLRLLDMVQLPSDSLNKYPHQFSGGQRQRIGIARALSLRPELLICDESVSALDVSIQAQILNLLKTLQQELGLTYLFISHDLNVVHYISDRVMVMQAGEIVETGNAEQVLLHPQHDYTKRLIGSMP